MTIQYLEELQIQGDIPPDLRKKLHLLTCEKVFDSYLNIYKQAVISNEPEHQYILYYRCGKIGTMIMQKNGFSDFSRKKDLSTTFAKLLDKLDELKIVLTKKHEESRRENPSVSIVPCEIKEAVSPELPLESKNSVSIKARELVRLVENEKKSAMVIDFRADQSRSNILYKKSANPILVISIPRELIKPGLLFSTLKHQLHVGQRPLLNKISTCDYVVLMDSGNPQFINNEPIPSTAAGILKLALTEYNVHDKLKSSPLFMEGGFESWILQYPMYVNKVGQNAGEHCVDSLESIVAGYKRATLPFDYPELSPKKVSKRTESPPPLVEIADIPENVSEYLPTLPDEEHDINGIGYITKEEIRAEIKELAEEINKNLPTSPILPRLAGGQSAVSVKKGNFANVGDMKISQPSVAKKPTFSRSDKPGDLTSKSFLRNSANNIQPRPSTSTPALDRSTKPSIHMSNEDQQTLMHIYSLMAQNIADNAVPGSNPPGQTGLYNMGNTCFMSACLQALFQTPKLVTIFTKDNFISRINVRNRLGTRGVISAVFSALVDNVWSGYFKAFKPKRFLNLFAKEVNEMLMNGEQQDASEFYMLLLGTLHEDTSEVLKAMPPVQNYYGEENIRREADDFDRLQLQFSSSPISRLMHPRTVAEVRCTSCTKKSIKFEDINIIQVGLPSPTMGRASLVDCLHNTFCVTDLDGLWDCPHCKVARPATQKLCLWKLPDVIVIHLLRFSFTGGDYVKNDIPVRFDPENLDMAAFLHSAADRHANSSYRLYSVTNHRGRLNSGHYTANCRHLLSREWLRFDDETVSRAAAGDINFSDAYILYFKKKDLEE